MEQISNSITSEIKIENGLQIIDINTDLDKYELLSLIFHKETVVVDTDRVFSTIKNDRKRYFEDTTVCYQCGQMGHVSRNCDVVKKNNCMYCDMDHKGKNCDFLFCDNCLKLGHTYRFCRERRFQPLNCKLCVNQNHYEEECPRIWRRYKLAKIETALELIMSCPLCFSNTHFLDDCEMQDRKYTIFTKEYKALLQKSHNNDKKNKKEKNK